MVYVGLYGKAFDFGGNDPSSFEKIAMFDLSRNEDALREEMRKLARTVFRAGARHAKFKRVRNSLEKIDVRGF
jgi:hypothetical protein